MKFNLNNKYVRWGLTAFSVVVASICFYYLLFHGAALKAGIGVVTNLLMPIVFGLITAYLMTPILNHIELYILIPICDFYKLKDSKKRKSFIRGVGIILTSVLVIAVIYFLIYMLLSQIVPSVMKIVNDFDTYINNFTIWIDQILKNNPDLSDYVIRMIDRYSGELETWLNETVLSKTSSVIKTVSLSVIGILGVLWDFILGFVISIYLMASKETFAGQAKKIVYALFERDTANIVIKNFRFTHRTFIGFISGKVLDSIIIGLLCFIGTTLLNTPYAALVSVVVGVTNVIPFFGPYLGAIPCAILIFLVDPMHPLNCVYFALFILVLQQVDGNILGPKILGESTGLTGFWVIFSITVFGGLWGVLGMVVGVPVFAIIYAAIKSLVNASLEKKKLPLDTKVYSTLGSIDEEGCHEYIPEYKLKKQNKENNKVRKNKAAADDLRSGETDIKDEKDKNL